MLYIYIAIGKTFLERGGGSLSVWGSSTHSQQCMHLVILHFHISYHIISLLFKCTMCQGTLGITVPCSTVNVRINKIKRINQESILYIYISSLNTLLRLTL